MSEPTIGTRSLSQYQSYVRCGEQYRLERIEKVPARPAAWLAQGTALHTAIEDWERQGRPHWSGYDIGDVFTNEYDRGIQEITEQEPNLNRWLPSGRYKPQTDIDRRRTLGTYQARSYVSQATGAPWKVYTLPDDSPALEAGFRLDLGTVIVNGFIDAVIEWNNGAVTVRDYKSGKLPSSPLQLGVYAIAASQSFGIDVPVTHGDYWIGQVDKQSGAVKGATEPIPLHRYSVDYLTKLFTDLDKGIAAGVFLPNPGDHCRICPVRDYCREMGGSSFGAES